VHGAPRARFCVKLDDDSMVRYDNLLVEALAMAARNETRELLWGRKGAWSFFCWWNFLMSWDVATGVARAPVPPHCVYHDDDVCLGEMSMPFARQLFDDARFYGLAPCNTPGSVYCRPIAENPLDSYDTMVAHHVQAPQMLQWYASRSGAKPHSP
jgi:hypothetical protein